MKGGKGLWLRRNALLKKGPRNTCGQLKICWNHETPVVLTEEESRARNYSDDSCPKCGNTDLQDAPTEKEPEEFLRQLLEELKNAESSVEYPEGDH